MSSSPFLSAATLSCEGVRVDSFKPLYRDTSTHAVSPHYRPLGKLLTAESFARLKAKGQ